MMKKIGTLIVFFFCFQPLFAAVYYVDASMPNNNGAGTSWATAKKDLQNAMAIASSGDQVWVKAGTYYPTVDLFNSTSPSDARDKTFLVPNGVSVYGGFAGTESLLTQRNIPNNQTVLSGDIGTANTSTDNCYHVLSIIDNTVASTLDGLIITDGTTSTSSSNVTVGSNTINRNRGAGVNIRNVTETTIAHVIKNCVIKNHLGGSNGNGAAISTFGTNLTMESCMVVNNTLSLTNTVTNGVGLNFGGVSNGTLTITNCLFESNRVTATTGGSGGAIQTGGTTNNFTNCTFTNNMTGSNGGAIHFSNTIHTSNFKNCIFYNNLKGTSATVYGADITFNGNTTNLTATNCMLQLTQSNDYVSSTTGLNAASSGNIFNNPTPSFRNASSIIGADNKYFTSDDGLSLLTGSVAINAGTSSGAPTTDIIGTTRTGNTDIGAYEFLATSTTWNGSTWSNGNPTSTLDAIIASSTAPSSFTCKALTINSTYALNTTGITVTVNGNITNSGNGISGTGTLVIAAASTLSGNAVTFGGTLNLSAGTFATGGLLSIAPGGSITGTYANISGSVTLQQSIIGQRGWRIFANPFSTTQTISTLASTNGITINTTAQASGLTDARTFSNSTNTWSNVTGSTIAANTAYSLFIRGLASEVTGTSYTAGPSAFTYKATGTLNGNSVSITPSSTSNFILVGNPYAAPVKTSALTNGTGVSYYVYTIAQGGTQTLQRTKAGSWAPVLSSSTTATIPVLGAVAYKPATTSSYSITASTDINTSGTLQTGLFREQNTIPHIELQVEQDGLYQDKLFVRLDNGATQNGTDRTDLEKFWNESTNIYTKTIDSKYLGVDARGMMDSIPVGISALAGNYVFKVAKNSLPAGYSTYLTDNFLHTRTELKENGSYSFSITSDAASKGEKRFVLEFSKAKPIAIAQDFEVKVLGNIIRGSGVNISIAGSDAPVSITVMDLLGRKLNTINNIANGTAQLQLGTKQTGMYLLHISNGRTAIVEKMMVQ